MYHVGLVGVRTSPHTERAWSSDALSQPLMAKLRPESEVFIHKTFWGALHVLRREKGDGGTSNGQ